MNENTEWDVSSVFELTDPSPGTTPKRSEDEYWEDGTIKWASARDISQNEGRWIQETDDKMTESGKEASNAEVLPKGTVVVTARGTVGEVAQLGEPMTVNQSCYILESSEDLLDDYLYYAWQFVVDYVQSMAHGAVFDAITKDTLNQIDIPVPPISTQREIADLLGTIDEKIEVNWAMSETLEDIAHAIYTSWFVDYEPYTEFKESELGDIPGEFEVCKLSEELDVILGGTPSSKNDDYWGGGVEWASAKDISQTSLAVLDETEKNITEKGVENSSTELVPEGTTVITARGTVGETAIVPREMAINQSCMGLLSPDSDVAYPYFLAASLERHLEKHANGAVFDAINTTQLREMEIASPPDDVLGEFEQLVRPLVYRIQANVDEIQTLAELRDYLLPQLLSGEIRLGGDDA